MSCWFKKFNFCFSIVVMTANCYEKYLEETKTKSNGKTTIPSVKNETFIEWLTLKRWIICPKYIFLKFKNYIHKVS